MSIMDVLAKVQDELLETYGLQVGILNGEICLKCGAKTQPLPKRHARMLGHLLLVLADDQGPATATL